jgi:hypothetical protein
LVELANRPQTEDLAWRRFHSRLRQRDWHFAYERTLNAERDETILEATRRRAERRNSDAPLRAL